MRIAPFWFAVAEVKWSRTFYCTLGVAQLTAFLNTTSCLTVPSKEFTMSARNGDKSRYHRERKQKIARRKRTHELLEQATKPHKQSESAGPARRHSVSA